jgi:hypothetical protein
LPSAFRSDSDRSAESMYEVPQNGKTIESIGNWPDDGKSNR